MTTDGFLVAATALHLGFQAAVTALVYPALAVVPEQRWAVEHSRHSRRITPVVALVYGSLVLAGAGVLLGGPSPLEVAAVLASGGAVLVTAAAAAPLHARLAGGPDPVLLRRLLVADRWRCALAATAAVLALIST